MLVRLAGVHFDECLCIEWSLPLLPDLAVNLLEHLCGLVNNCLLCILHRHLFQLWLLLIVLHILFLFLLVLLLALILLRHGIHYICNRLVLRLLWLWLHTVVLLLLLQRTRIQRLQLTGWQLCLYLRPCILLTLGQQSCLGFGTYYLTRVFIFTGLLLTLSRLLIFFAECFLHPFLGGWWLGRSSLLFYWLLIILFTALFTPLYFWICLLPSTHWTTSNYHHSIIYFGASAVLAGDNDLP